MDATSLDPEARLIALENRLIALERNTLARIGDLQLKVIEQRGDAIRRARGREAELASQLEEALADAKLKGGNRIAPQVRPGP